MSIPGKVIDDFLNEIVVISYDGLPTPMHYLYLWLNNYQHIIFISSSKAEIVYRRNAIKDGLKLKLDKLLFDLERLERVLPGELQNATPGSTESTDKETTK